MQVVLKQGASKKDIKAVEKKLFQQKSNGFDAKKYNGLLHLRECPLAIQLALRDEWEASPSNIF
jgi:hypothetical protein